MKIRELIDAPTLIWAGVASFMISPYRIQWFAESDFVNTAGSYVSANDKRVHFGLGTDKVVKTLKVNWPSGALQPLREIDAGRILTVNESQRPQSR